MVPTDAPELASLTATVEQVTAQLTTIAERLATDPDHNDVAPELFEAERLLRATLRPLDRAGRMLSERRRTSTPEE